MDDFCKDHYFHEIERRRSLQNGLSLPIGIVTILSGILITVTRAFNTPYSDLEFVFLFFVISAVISLTTSIVFILKSHIGFTYGYIASPLKLQNYRNELFQYYSSNDEKNANRLANENVEKYIFREYAKLADYNAKKNDMKSYNLHCANISIIFALIFCILSSIPYVYSYLGQASPVN